MVANDSLQRADTIDGLAIRRDDHITRLQSGSPRRSILAGEAANEDATNVLHAGDRLVFRGHAVNADAERWNANVPAGDDLVHHTLGERDWNREAITRVVAGR